MLTLQIPGSFFAVHDMRFDMKIVGPQGTVLVKAATSFRDVFTEDRRLRLPIDPPRLMQLAIDGATILLEPTETGPVELELALS